MLVAPDATTRGLGIAVLNAVDQRPLRVKGISTLPPLTPTQVGQLYGWPSKHISPSMALKASQFSFGYAIAALVEHEDETIDPHSYVAELKGPHTPRRASPSTIRGRLQSSNAFFNLMHTSEPGSVLADLSVFAEAATLRPNMADRLPPLSDGGSSLPSSFREVLKIVRSRLSREAVPPAEEPSGQQSWSLKSLSYVLRQLDGDDSGTMPSTEAQQLWSALRLWRRYDAELLSTIPARLEAAAVRLTPWEERLLLTSIGSVVALRSRWQ